MVLSLRNPPHKQVDSGLGFECDEGIVKLVRLFNKIPGITTQFSCQGGCGDDAQVLFAGTLNDLLYFCKLLRPLLSNRDHYSGEEHTGASRFSFDWLKLMFQQDNIQPDGKNYGGIRGELTFASSQMGRITRTIRTLLKNWPKHHGKRII